MWKCTALLLVLNTPLFFNPSYAQQLRETHTMISAKQINPFLKNGEGFDKDDFNLLEKNVLRDKLNQLVGAKIKAGEFINDPEIESILQELLRSLSEANPELRFPGRLLIERNPFVNAHSFGEGTVSVSSGMLAKINSYDQLAFVLAHEASHYHLQHSMIKLREAMRSRDYVRVEAALKKIPQDRFDLDDLKLLRRWYYEQRSYSREMEMEADSLAKIIYCNAGFSAIGIDNAFELLEHNTWPIQPLGSHLFDDLNFRQYPFKSRWVAPLPSIRYNRPSSVVLDQDSIQSHPDLSTRLSIMKSSPCHDKIYPKGFSEDRLSWIVESIESAFYYRRYDYGLHMALQLMQMDEGYHTHGVALVAYTLLTVADAKMDNVLYEYIPFSSYGYHPESMAINTFLANIEANELIEIVYHFLRRPGNFDTANPMHYQLLYQVYDSKYLKQQKNKLARDYKDKFDSSPIRSEIQLRD